MATRSNVKGFYKQKKSSGISKKKHSPPPRKAAASLGSDVTQSTTASSTPTNPIDDYNEQEELLRQFDMNMAYGPCAGMTRLARWERACILGLNPPKEVESLLKGGKVCSECLWDGRI